MTDQLHRTISLQRLDRAIGSPAITHLASPRGLVAHIGVLLVTTSTLALINLLVSPESQWAGAILVVWLLVLVAHGLGIVIARLMTDDSTTRRRPAVPASDDDHGWAQPGSPGTSERAVAGDRSISDSWKDVAAPDDETETSWPSVVTAEPDPDDGSETDIEATSTNDAVDERVPWRAATEIAWLRKWQDAKDEDESQQRHSAS